MEKAEHSQREAAHQQLKCALDLFFEGKYFAAITLAGAAEELLGKELDSGHHQNALDAYVAGAVRVDKHLNPLDEDPDLEQRVRRSANEARNASKHPRAGGMIYWNPKEEAKTMLNRAIDNFWDLTTTLTPAMRKFQDLTVAPQTNTSARMEEPSDL